MTATGAESRRCNRYFAANLSICELAMSTTCPPSSALKKIFSSKGYSSDVQKHGSNGLRLANHTRNCAMTTPEMCMHAIIMMLGSLILEFSRLLQTITSVFSHGAHRPPTMSYLSACRYLCPQYSGPPMPSGSRLPLRQVGNEVIDPRSF